MHWALIILDIILEIVVHVRLPSSDYFGFRHLYWKNLAALARTCKAFHKPTMLNIAQPDSLGGEQ